MIARFGPAGKGELFQKKYKKTEDTVSYLMDFGLNAYEYQCGRGVRINEEAVKHLGAEAKNRASPFPFMRLTISPFPRWRRKSGIRVWIIFYKVPKRRI